MFEIVCDKQIKPAANFLLGNVMAYFANLTTNNNKWRRPVCFLFNHLLFKSFNLFDVLCSISLRVIHCQAIYLKCHCTCVPSKNISYQFSNKTVTPSNLTYFQSILKSRYTIHTYLQKWIRSLDRDNMSAF